MVETVNVECKQVRRDLLLKYALTIAKDAVNSKKDSLQDRIDAHNAILDSINEEHDSDWAKEELHSFMGTFLMRPAVVHYLEDQGIDRHDMMNIVNTFFVGM